MLLASTELDNPNADSGQINTSQEKEMLQLMRGRLGITGVVYGSEPDRSPRK